MIKVVTKMLLAGQALRPKLSQLPSPWLASLAWIMWWQTQVWWAVASLPEAAWLQLAPKTLHKSASSRLGQAAHTTRHNRPCSSYWTPIKTWVSWASMISQMRNLKRRQTLPSWCSEKKTWCLGLRSSSSRRPYLWNRKICMRNFLNSNHSRLQRKQPTIK